MTAPVWYYVLAVVIPATTLTGGVLWVVLIFWPALREQLKFLRESTREMAVARKDRVEMVSTLVDLKETLQEMRPVVVDAKEVVDELKQVNWKDTMTKSRKLYDFTERWLDRITPQREKNGVRKLEQAFGILAKLDKVVNGSGRR